MMSKHGFVSLLLLCCLHYNVVVAAFSSVAHTTSSSSLSPSVVQGRQPLKNADATKRTFSSCTSLQLRRRDSDILLETKTVNGEDSSSKDSAMELLDDALKYNTTAASALLSTIQQLRTSPMTQGEKLEEYLNALLEQVDSPQKKTLLWTKVRPLARFSKRARRASLRRVLDLSTPLSADDDDDDTIENKKNVIDIEDTNNAKKRRRRQAFLILLRALASIDDTEKDMDQDTTSTKTRRGGVVKIVALEKTAIRDAKAAVLKGGSSDMESRMPTGLETPNYTVLSKNTKKGYEIRKYEPFAVCSVQMNKPRQNPSETDAQVSNPQLKGASAFGALAGYLFGKNQESTAMKMTTPVLSQGEGQDKTMSFVLPSDYWNESGLDKAPTPLEGSGVALQRLEGEERAAIMFGGFASKKETTSRKTYLLKSLEKDPSWMPATSDEEVTLAQYNDPFTPPWKRRNEVSIKVVSRK